MDISRRQFNRGMLALAATTAMPLQFVPAQAGFDDAYARILSELCRVEEAAGLAGRASAGAMTWKGRQLESFLGALDIRVDPVQSAGQVFGQLRDFLTDKASKIARQEDEGAQAIARQMRSYAETWVDKAGTSDDDAGPVLQRGADLS